MIEILPEERWSEIEDVLDKTFNSTLPNKGRSVVVADIEDGEIKGFILVEMLARPGVIWTGGGGSARSLVKYVENSMAPESSAVVIASDERFESLCRKLGMYEVPGKLFRRDF